MIVCLILSCFLSLFHCLHQQFDYYNSLLINDKDENDNYVELGDEFILEPNEHFNNLLVNTTYSDIQLPTNVYNKGNGLYFLTTSRLLWKQPVIILKEMMGILKTPTTDRKENRAGKILSQGMAMSVL